MNMRKLKALWTLGMALLKKIVLTPFVRPSGARAWLARIGQEGLTPTPEGAWTRFERSSRCIGCGLCAVAGGPSDAPSAWVMGAGRRPEDAALVTHEAARLDELARGIARVCPARVGVAELAALMRANARLLAG